MPWCTKLWTAFLPAIRTARDWIDDGRIGEILQVRADFGFRAPFDAGSRLWNPALAGGAMLRVPRRRIAPVMESARQRSGEGAGTVWRLCAQRIVRAAAY